MNLTYLKYEPLTERERERFTWHVISLITTYISIQRESCQRTSKERSTTEFSSNLRQMRIWKVITTALLSWCFDLNVYRFNFLQYKLNALLYLYFIRYILKVRENWWLVLAARMLWLTIWLTKLYTKSHLLQMCHSLRHNIDFSWMFLGFFLSLNVYLYMDGVLYRIISIQWFFCV